MKQRFLFWPILFAILLYGFNTLADDNKNEGDEPLRRSQFFEPSPFYENSSYPRPFSALDNPITQPSISTGYYFVDSDDDAPDYWRPSVFIYDTNEEPGLWRRIVPGPRILPRTYWSQYPEEGLRFFRNPAYPSDGNFFEGATDSTDDAFAGPIPIGFNFYFNGIRYDSFYVTTNGLIALSNRRYFYDAAGNRTIPTGATSCYDPMSMDWFTRGRTGDGLTDATADNWGYQFVALGNDRTSPQAGIRSRGGALGGSAAPGFISSYRAALIAPFWGQLHLSQFNKTVAMPEDYGKVYFKRTVTADRLIIYFVNAAPLGSMSTPLGTFTAPTDGRFGESNYISANAQVILDKRDSSITIIYERFDGVAVVSGRAVPSHVVFRYNTTVGVTGFARHVNFGQPGGPTYPWAGEYQQYTHYFMRLSNPNVDYPRNSLAIKFKQWKNTCRVVFIEYLTRKPDPRAGIEFTERVPPDKVNNYELLAGDEKLGAIQPVAVLQNLSNNIQGPQGVNYQPQQFTFFARFLIVNVASDRKVYNHLVPIDSTCLALGFRDTLLEQCMGDPMAKVTYVRVTTGTGGAINVTPLPFPGTERYNGIPPYGFVQVRFPPFEPSDVAVNQIGRLRAYIIAEPRNPRTQESWGDTWPFDDTGFVRLFVMKRLEDFSDDVTSFHIAERTPMPSTLKWVNIDAEVASGDEVSYYPLPPRGEYAATNNPDFNIKTPDYTQFKLRSPVIRMNRLTLERQEPATSPGGDEIRSFPINLLNKKTAVISVGFQRATKQDSWDRGWCDNQLVGMEPRSVVNGDVFSNWTGYGGAASNPPDEIAIDWALPSDDGITQICNIDERRWRNHPRRGGARPVTDMPAYSLFGAGGYLIGYLETDKDSALSQPSAPNLNGLRPRLFDDGIDFDYVKAFVTIPDTVLRYQKEGAKNFRFRIKMYARNNRKCITCIPDDDDVCYVDNVKLLFPTEITDIELTTVRTVWPYKVVPASQAIKVPVRVKLSNNTGVPAPGFLVTVMIYRPGERLAVYKRTSQLPGMLPATTHELAMPDFNARLYGPGEYRIYAWVTIPGGDIEPINDTNYIDITLNFGEFFAYDNPTNIRNDVPDNQFTGVIGRGLNLFGFAEGGSGRLSGPSSGYSTDWAAGVLAGSGSGQIAMRFTLYQQDTLYGYQALFGEKNQSPDMISFEVYRGTDQPSTKIGGSLLYTLRAWDFKGDSIAPNKILTYLLTKPVILQSGTYWVSISQLGQDPIELGASKYRMGMRITSIYIPPPVTSGGPVGGSGYHLMIEKDFRKLSPTLNLVNDNVFAYENTRGSGNWVQFMPTIGNPGYGHLHHFGITPADNYTATLSRGTWIPYIRPYLGNRWFLRLEAVHDPVELLTFDGRARDAGIDLFWETSSERNNYGFFIERRVGTDETTEFKDIGFVKGAGFSTAPTRYSFFDKNVVPNTTYQYRLRQVDNDGTGANFTHSQIITIKYLGIGELELFQNAPNPFATTTTIPFTLPVDSRVRLEILDVYGKVVKTLVDEDLPAGNYNSFVWDGTDLNGNLAPSGNYIYRLVANGRTLTGVMT
ncbi:MAG: hypothetical protein N2517_00005, partial [Ignavibacteria bacterium]|nr:hypothetical protein [Ignavibacteria bacterium]